MDLYLPFDKDKIDLLYNYSDDLMHIHRQLAKALQQNQLPVGVKVIEVEAAIKCLFDEDLLDTAGVLSKKEARSKYAVKHFEEVSGIIRSAHHRVIRLFHECWGVLPSTELDDYRLMGVVPLSLSQEFIEEACASSEAQKHPVPAAAVTCLNFQTHHSEPNGHMKHAVYTESFEAFVQHTRRWFRRGYVTFSQETQRPVLEEKAPYGTKHGPYGVFLCEGNVLGFANEFNLEGTSWAGKIAWYTLNEMQAMYAEGSQ